MKMRAYIIVWLAGIRRISLWDKKKMVLVPLVRHSLPWARQWISLLIAGTQITFRFGSYWNFLYCVMVSFCNWMPYTKTEILNVDDGSSPLWISSNFYGFKCHDVVQSLDGDVAGHAWLDDSSGAPRTFRLGGQIKFGTIYIHTQLNTTAYVGIPTKTTQNKQKKRPSWACPSRTLPLPPNIATVILLSL